MKQKCRDLNSNLTLTQSLTKGASAHLNIQPPTDTDKHHPAAAKSQCMIKGQFSKKWAIAQDRQHLKILKNVDSKCSGPTWATEMTTACCNWPWELWELRNSELHGKDKETKKLANREKVMREIKALHSIRDEVLPKHQDAFMDAFEEHIKKLKTTCHLPEDMGQCMETTDNVQLQRSN